ncbi:hypothetical protein, partial [Pseudomonas syringae]|uniref:hypothetical protein n=1 Tax=Pseudomonas syringae TaxID=317 RepID=UPI001FEE9A62
CSQCYSNRSACVALLRSDVHNLSRKVVEEAGLATGFFLPEIWYWMNQQPIRCTTCPTRLSG